MTRIPFALALALCTLVPACSDTQASSGSPWSDEAGTPSDGGKRDSIAVEAGIPSDSKPVASLLWDSESVVATGDLSIAFNNTRVGARDQQEGLHVVWAEAQKTVRYGYLANGATSWAIRDVPRTSTGGVSKPTLAINGTTVIVVWNETGPTGAIVGNASTDFGATWKGALPISDGPGASASLLSTGTSSTYAASVAWIDATTKRLKVRAIAGASWGTSMLSAVQTLDTNSTSPAGDPQIFGTAPELWIVWDNGEEGAGHELHLAQSSDGVHFSNERVLGVTQPSRTPNSGNDASGCAVGSSVYLVYQDGNGIYLARSSDRGKTFEPKGKLGDGLFAHVECITNRAVAVAWESFTGPNSKNDGVKTVGASYTLDGFDTVTGPHAIPGSETQTSRILGTASQSEKFLDYWWVEKSGATSNLGHRSARIVRD